MPLTSSRPALHYERDGKGPALVLSHALGCSLDMWDDIVPALATEWTVIRYDARSHGRSDVITTAFSIGDLMGDAVRLLDELNCDQVTWVGLSMGGMIGQGLATTHPLRIARLVLANAVSRYSDEGRAMWSDRARVARSEGMAALADLLMGRYFSDEFRAARQDVVAQFRNEVLDLNPEGYAACCEAISSLDYYAHLPRIVCPTLVIGSERDVAATPPMVAEIAERIPGAELASIPDAGHLSVVEQPKAFLEIVTAFLRVA
jgi:3-oxoadipate enol-lactonase